MVEFNTVDAQSAAERAQPDDDVAAGHRTLLARKLSDIVVLPASRLSSNERSLTADILIQVLARTGVATRIEIAERVARVAESPPALLRALLTDKAGVAKALLADAASIPTPLLIECARRGGPDHRRAVAARADLDAIVVDVLLEHRDVDVMRQILRSESVDLSPNAVDTLVARSATDPELQSLLLRRPELEPAHGFIMFWWMDATRRKRILSRFALNRRILQEAVLDFYPRMRGLRAPDPTVKQVLGMLDPRHRPRGNNGEAVSFEVVLKTLAAAHRRPTQEITQALCIIAGVSRELAARVLRDKGGEPFAVLAKSVGAPREMYFQMISRQGVERPISEKRAEALLEVFDSFSRDFSRAVLRYWDWDGNPRIAAILNLLAAEQDQF